VSAFFYDSWVFNEIFSSVEIELLICQASIWRRAKTLIYKYAIINVTNMRELDKVLDQNEKVFGREDQSSGHFCWAVL